MKKNFLNLMAFSVVAMAMGVVSAQKPAKPENLQADVVGHKVTLNWTNPDAGETLLTTGFEGENPFEGWTIQTTNTQRSVFTWFSYPQGLELEEGEKFDTNYVYEGQKSAMVAFDNDLMTEHPKHQDEWLISPEKAGAAYLSFHYFIDPMILEWGVEENFPDHYVVVVSKDGGETWSEPLWDARYDASAEYGWAMAVLALDENPTDKMKVAFRAYGEKQTDENGKEVNQGNYFTWTLDDVKLTASVPTVDEAALATKPVPAGKMYREFVADHHRSFRAAKRYNPNAKKPIVCSYNLFLDDEVLVEGVLSTMYIDKSEKTAGKRTYKVVAVSGEEVSEAAAIEVELAEAVFAQPRNVALRAEKDEEYGDYEVFLSWEAPEGDFQPIYYQVYAEGEQVGWEIEDLEFSQYGYTPGVYDFGVEAVYECPDGVSEQVVRYIALEVRYNVTDLTAEMKGEDVSLAWKAPQEDGTHTVASYTVYRSGDKIAENIKETTYLDKAVEAGLYQYTVIAVYEDGVESPRTTVDLQVGERQFVKLPYEQKFANTFRPKDIKVENLSEWAPDNYVWYFDDGERLKVEGDGFEGCYAAIDCYEAGFTPIDATLELPPFDIKDIQHKADMTLSFYYSYATSGEDQTGVEWSLDGVEWYLLLALEGYNPEETEEGDFQIQKIEFPMSEAYEEAQAAINAAETLYLRFRYTGTDAYHMAIDNVLMTIPGEGPIDPPAAVERMAEDAEVVVAAFGGRLQVKAANAIEKVEVIACNGVKMMDVRGNGSLEMSLPVADRGVVLVRVTTAQGVKVVKILL